MLPLHIEIWNDLHAERSGFYRAFWVRPGETAGSPLRGYCEASGSFRTIREAVADCRRLGHSEPIYRNGRLISPPID